MRPSSLAPRLEAAKLRLAAHPVYGAVRDLASLRVFMQHHVACVLDFMSLLKRLQTGLTTVTTPWVPPADPTLARFVNELVLDEESDAAFGERPASHFEWYLHAMAEVGADSGPIRRCVDALRAGRPWRDALAGAGLPAPAERFAATTFELAEGPLHAVAAVFFHGREDVIPRMFLPLVAELRAQGLACPLLEGYLVRHIEVDGGAHGPTAERMLASLFGGDGARRREAEAAAERALAAREALWDAVAVACGAAAPSGAP